MRPVLEFIGIIAILVFIWFVLDWHSYDRFQENTHYQILYFQLKKEVEPQPTPTPSATPLSSPSPTVLY